MAAVLKSASTNQTLRLAFKALALSLVLLWLRSAGLPVGVSLIFLTTFTLFYTSPPLGNTKYLSSAIVLLITPFFVRVLGGTHEAIFIIGWGIAFFLLVSIKNLVLLNRVNIYRVIHFVLVATLSFLLIERFGFVSQAVVFTALLFIFREFYINFSETGIEEKTLIAAVESFILIEISWMLSFLSAGVFISAAFLTLFTLIFHDTTVHKLGGTLNKQVVVRNGTVFAVLTAVIIIVSSIGGVV